MPLPPVLQKLRLPVICAPMFIAGNPKLVIEQCKAGVVGSFPALNARPKETLDAWLTEIETALAGAPGAAPYAVNQICHKSNDRLDYDIEVCIRHQVPITITSLRAPADVIPKIHAYGGIVLHDVISVRHAEKALEDGVDGLILVCAGAGGHTGSVSPFVFVHAVRQFFDGIVVLAGGLCTGAAIRAAEIAGADLAVVGTLFIAARESLASDEYRQMVVDAGADDLVLTRAFTGANAYYLRRSIECSGLDPDNLSGKTSMDWSQSGRELKAWKDIWSAGQSVEAVRRIESTAEIVERLRREYREALSHPGFET
jgi:nitronate monooxygenase